MLVYHPNIFQSREFTYLKCYLPTCLAAVVNYPNIGRNFLLSADHRVPYYPHPRPSKCDYRLQSSTHVITAPAAAAAASGGSACLV